MYVQHSKYVKPKIQNFYFSISRSSKNSELARIKKENSKDLMKCRRSNSKSVNCNNIKGQNVN